MKISFFLTCISLSLLMNAQTATPQYLAAGTYTGGKSEGIYILAFDTATGSLRQHTVTKASNPSFVTVSPDGKYVYAVHENGSDQGGGSISAYAFNTDEGRLRLLNTLPTQGDHPCHAETDKTGKWVIASNYSGGNFTVYPVQEDGSLGAATASIQHYGKGKNPERQEKPHVHSATISPDNNWLFVADLGTDQLVLYRMAADGKPEAGTAAKTNPGDGPRHFTFHPNGKYAYAVQELSGKIITYDYKDGKLRQVQRISTLADGEKDFAGSADIHVSPDGKFVYATNRGNYNNIAIYQVNPKNGRLDVVGFQSTLGKGPRNFTIDPSGRFLLVANQNSDEIVVFSRNRESGLLDDTGHRLAIGKPVCLQWIGGLN